MLYITKAVISQTAKGPLELKITGSTASHNGKKTVLREAELVAKCLGATSDRPDVEQVLSLLHSPPRERPQKGTVSSWMLICPPRYLYNTLPW